MAWTYGAVASNAPCSFDVFRMAGTSELQLSLGCLPRRALCWRKVFVAELHHLQDAVEVPATDCWRPNNLTLRTGIQPWTSACHH